MSQLLVINGTSYTFPDVGEEEWGQNVTDWAVAVTSGMLQKAGGSFILTAEVDFGANFGLKAAYYKSRATNVAAAGIVRLGNTERVSWRNAANSGDLALLVNAADELEFNGTSISTAAKPLLATPVDESLPTPTLPGATYKTLYNQINAVNTTVYTVPVGKKALFLGIYAMDVSGNSNNYDVTFNINGVDTLVVSGSSVSANTKSDDNLFGFVLEAGDQIKLNTTDVMNMYTRIAEFDASYPIFSAVFSTLSAGNNTLYTVPPSKSAFFFPGNANETSSGIFFFNSSGGDIDIYPMLVKSGGSPGTAYQTDAVQTVSDGSGTTPAIPEVAQAGDTVRLNLDVPLTSGLVWLTYVEL